MEVETLSDQEIVEDVAKDLREVSDALKPFTVFSATNKTPATNGSPCTSTSEDDEHDCDVEDQSLCYNLIILFNFFL